MKIPHFLLILAVFISAMSSSLSVQSAGWQSTSSLNTTRGAAGVIEIKGRLYVIGGIDGWRFLRTSEYTTIEPDGTLAPWQEGSSLSEDRGFFGVAEHNGYVYAVGGGNGPNGHNLLRSVERAKLLPDGRLGPWQQEKQHLNLPRRCSKVLVIGGYLYAFGGFGGTLFDTIERAQINADGTLAAWEILPERFTIPRYIHAMADVEGTLYAVGGHSEQGGTGIDAVEYSMLQTNGELANWQQSAPLKQGRYGLSAVAHGGFVYAMGGLNGATFFDAIERSRINADGSLGEWQNIASLPAPFADVGVVTYQDWIYVIGGTNRDGYYNNVFVARLDGLASGNAGIKSSVQAPKPSKPVLMPNEGVIMELIDGGAYIYASIDLGAGKFEWLATGKSDVKVGDHVRYSPGVFMENFYSKGLQRKFELIRFVGKLERVPEV